jgi:hypothetical protein
MNLSRLKKPLKESIEFDDTILTPEEKAELDAIRERNIWIPMEDVLASFRVIDKMTEHEKV